MTKIGAGGIALTGEEIAVETGDGIRLNAMLYRPSMAASGPRPAVILCPGGVGTGMFEIVEWLAGPLRDAGFVALTMNWRSGLPDHDPDDVSAGIDWLRAQPGVDGSRIGVMGMSRGGNAALRATARDQRLKACVTFGAVTDLLQQAQGVKDYAPGRYRMFLDWLGSPEENADRYRAVSAITEAAKIRQPLLLVHGQHDMHSPPEQSLWMNEAVRAGGNGESRVEIVPMMCHYGDVIPNHFGFDRLRSIIIPFLIERL
ncbi:prolyl oligopeptidase family serine peptidase [Sphingomonas histidinilytica]|jgi:dipeptidyl aminopeptidase/acylaminoacyl peptidase|uniref:Prolyl oligopeptidase family protein n=1 Tax=Rhizorhabdus histidinilytica TaxID=439228 RepID=A0A1T5FNN8_9SPHN|nr:prolyl oligopeptidase family serine peptidase [Rhizorhabdus histidinilytica]MBO9377138.1 prolyl oligopeptidase family serine peptidase [Rhizorhabdus histidinilytica]QEH79982.1 prolyl oligopeptidase family serine peptidase [Sphingomonas sp. C8-2]SKB97687.1 Prolyl oligopeptidase family protein [Rhizorhabdus histidinilytica]